MTTIAKNNTNLEQILNEDGYDLYFKNLEIEDELLEGFSRLAVYPLLSRFSTAASSIEPFNHYLDSVMATADFLQKISNQEVRDSTFLDVIKSLDVSESLKYMFGEGLDKDVAAIEEEYDTMLTLVEEAFPTISFRKRYPFTDNMRKFSKMYLAQALKPFANIMTEHQMQLKRTFELFKTYMKGKKDLQSTYFLSKLAGHFLGGIAGSMAVTALFSGMNSRGEREFSEELSTAHQTWYAIQNTNLTDTCTANYRPRLHHLYLSLVGGLLQKINKDLYALGFEISEVGLTAEWLKVELHPEGEKAFKQRLDLLLESSANLEEVISTINTFAAYPALIGLLDEQNHLYIERVIVLYLYLQAKSLTETNTYYSGTDHLPSFNWVKERTNAAFSFLLDDNYKEIIESIEDAFFDYPEDMHKIYLSIVEKYELYAWGNIDKTCKLLYRDELAVVYLASSFAVLEKVPDFLIEEMYDIKENSLLPYLETLENSQAACQLAEKWLPTARKGGFFAKIADKFGGESKLENAIQHLDYAAVKKCFDEGTKVRSLTVTPEMVRLTYRPFLDLLAGFLGKIDLKIDQETLSTIIENDDPDAMFALLQLGLDPFTPMNGTYLLAKVTAQGSFLMADTLYHFCQDSIQQYQNSVQKLPDGQLSPYYFLYYAGKTYWPEKYPELIQRIPVEQREKEAAMAVSSLTGILLWKMFEAGYDRRFVSLAAQNDNSFFRNLCSSNNYYVLNRLHEFDPTLLETNVMGIPMLREIYELGHIDMAEHFHQVFGIYEIGTVSYDDVERAAVSELNENLLILLNHHVDGVEDALREIQQKANEYRQWVIVDLIERVLSA